MTRNQIKMKISEIRELMLDLRDEIESTLDEIQPYDGKDELTPQQEEREEWLNDCQYELENALDNLEEFEI